MAQPLATNGPDLNTETTPLYMLPASSDSVIKSTVDDAWNTNPVYSIKKWWDLPSQTEGEMVDTKTAKEEVRAESLDLFISRDGISRAKLDVLKERKKAENLRKGIIARAPEGMAIPQFVAGLGTSIVDPLNILSGFIPVVGQARYARMLAKTSGLFKRTGVRSGVGAAEGAVGAVALEPLIYLSAQAEQADYTFNDSLMNVAFGTIMGAGFHSGIGGAKDVYNIVRGKDVDWKITSKYREEKQKVDDSIDALSPNSRHAVMDVSLRLEAQGQKTQTDALVTSLLDKEQATRIRDQKLSQPAKQEQPELSNNVSRLKEMRTEINQRIVEIDDFTELKQTDVIENMSPAERGDLDAAKKSLTSKNVSAKAKKAAQKKYDEIYAKAEARIEKETRVSMKEEMTKLKAEKRALNKEIKDTAARARQGATSKEPVVDSSQEVDFRLKSRDEAVKTEQTNAVKPENARVFDNEALTEFDSATQAPEPKSPVESLDEIQSLELEARAEALRNGVDYTEHVPSDEITTMATAARTLGKCGLGMT
tara:strand:- start:3197 stop:4807 length:1611 start_codon:yes stop_codon:yes gene_type:complete